MIGPNRKLRMQHVKHERAPFPSGMLALANMRPGELFVLHRIRYTVKSISDKSVVFDTDAGRKTLGRTSVRVAQFFEQLDDLLFAHALGAIDAGDLARAWERDPAFTPWPRPTRITHPVVPVAPALKGLAL